jgi:hypothetical protein
MIFPQSPSHGLRGVICEGVGGQKHLCFTTRTLKDVSETERKSERGRERERKRQRERERGRERGREGERERERWGREREGEGEREKGGGKRKEGGGALRVGRTVANALKTPKIMSSVDRFLTIE